MTQLWKSYLALGRLHEERKRKESARESFRAARQVVDGMKAGLRSPELRSSLESAPMIQTIYELSRL